MLTVYQTIVFLQSFFSMKFWIQWYKTFKYMEYLINFFNLGQTGIALVWCPFYLESTCLSEIAAKLPHSKLWWINGFKDWWTCYVSQFICSEKPFDQQCLIWKSLTVAASWKTQPLCGLYYTWPRVVLLIKKAMDVMETFF